ncbi:MAG: acyl-CoA dehydrogenase [Pseudomonadota bacterium]
MSFIRTEEQDMLAATVERFVSERYDLEQRARALAEAGGFSRDNLAQLAELGVLALRLPEAQGGLGGTLSDAAVVAETLGHGPIVEPVLISAFVCAPLMAEHGHDTQAALAERVAGGDAVLSLAFAEPEARFSTWPRGTRAERQGDGFVLRGSKTAVPGPVTLDAVIVPALLDDRLEMFVLPPGTPGVGAREYRLVDGTPALELTLDDVGLDADAHLPGGDAAYTDALMRARILASAEMLGLMERLFAETLDYLKTRIQFGRPIGRNQALQHRMAEHHVRLEQSRSAVMRACMTHDRGSDAWHREALAAKACVSDAAMAVGQDAVQMHGAMGTTDELMIGHYHKRALWLQSLLGDAATHYRLFDAAGGAPRDAA